MPNDSTQSRRRRRRSSLIIDAEPNNAKADERRSTRRQRKRQRRQVLNALGVLAVIGLLGFGLSLVIESLFDETDANAYEQARQQFETGEFQAAAVTLEAVIKRDHRNLPARVLAGRAYLALGYAADAEQALRHALQQGADRGLVAGPLAEAYLAQGKLQQLFEELPTNASDPDLRAQLLEVHGRAFLQLRELDKAERAFDAAARLHPDAEGPLTGLALVMLGRGRPDEAIDLVRRAGELAPGDPEVWFVSGEIQRSRNQPDTAIQAYTRALDIDPSHVRARLARANALIQRDRDQPALADLKVVWQSRPEDPEANYLYALILSKVQETAKAQAIIEKAALGLMSYRTEFVLRHPPSLLLMGILHYRNRRYDDAFPLLDRYVQLEPTNVGARKLLGSVMLIKDLPAGALDILAPALPSNPDDPELLALLGQAHTQNGQPRRAAELLARATEVAPERDGTRSQIALTRLAIHSGAAGDDALDSAFDVGAGEQGTSMLVNMLQLDRSRPEVALETTRTLVTARPKDPNALNLYGAVLLSLGRAEQAGEQFAGAITLEPNHPPAHRNLARADARQGRFDAAVARLEKLLGRQPDDTRAMTVLALIAERRHQRDVAVTWLERIGQADPDNVAAQLKLVDLLLERRDAARARELAAALQERFPDSVPIRIALGRIELAQGDATKASETFRTLAQEESTSAARTFRIVKYQLATNDVEGARSTLGRVLDLDPDFLAAHEQLVELDLREGDADSALARASRLREARPDSEIGDRLYGDVLAYERRFEDALAAYRAGLRKASSPELAVRVYDSLRALGREAAALADLERWSRQYAEDERLLHALASAYVAAERIPDAAAAYERLARSAPDDAEALGHLARLYRALGDPRAAEFAERAYEFDDGNAVVLDALGWIRVTDGDPAAGLALLREAHDRDASNPRIQYHVASALARLGRRDEARREIKRALRTDASFEGRADALRLLEELGGA